MALPETKITVGTTYKCDNGWLRRVDKIELREGVMGQYQSVRFSSGHPHRRGGHLRPQPGYWHIEAFARSCVAALKS